jgi:hypothetical protein
MSKAPKFDPAELARTLERMTQGKDFGQGEQRPEFDHKLHKDVVDASVRGRRVEEYKQVLDHYQFSYFPADKCPRLQNGQHPTEGQWRSQKYRMAFTSDEVCAHFPAGPMEFDQWMKKQILKRRAAVSGLLLPS